MNNKGQQIMIGLMMLVMAIIIFVATLPAIKSVINDARGCSYLNCAGYVKSGATGASCTSTNQSYDAGLEEDTLSCTVIDLGIPYLILGVLVGLIGLLLSGKLSQQSQPAPDYSQYAYTGGY